MKPSTPVLITAVSIILAASSLSFGITASKQRKVAEAEAEILRNKIAQMPTQKRRQESPQSSPDERAQATPSSTNEWVAQHSTLTEEAIEPPKRESREDRMARMKEEDPEGYAEMIKRRSEFQEKMKYNLAERTATFMDMDTSSMNEKELKNHDLLVEKMATFWALTDQFNDPEQPPDREAMREFFEVAREVRPLMEAERVILFKQLGTDLGYEGKDVKKFAKHIDEIISATSIQMPRGGGGGRGR